MKPGKWMSLSKYLDPKNDIAFKRIFGAEKNKDILIHFLNDILNKTAGDAIKDVRFLDTVQQPEIAIKKQSAVDVLCTDQSGIKYIVEMQVDPAKGFEKRAQYYAAKAYCSQMKKTGSYRDLKEVIFLAIADYLVFPDKPHYKSDHVILDKNSYEHNLRDFSFTFIELPKFKKKISELETYEERWCYFFKHAAESENIKELIASSGEIIKKACEELYSYNWTEAELQAYERMEKIDLDNAAREEYLLEKGMEKGIEKSLRFVVSNMLAAGQAVPFISQATGLSEEEILKLKDDIEREPFN